MKSAKTLVFLAMLGMLLSFGCKKSGSKPQTATANMTFKFNGTAETATLIVATYYQSQKSVQIIGSLNSQSQGLNLSIENPATTTYDLSTNSGVIASFSTALDFQHTYLGTVGKVVITTFNSSTIAGTFEFSGTDGDGQAGNVTDGTFSAKLITQ